MVTMKKFSMRGVLNRTLALAAAIALLLGQVRPVLASDVDLTSTTKTYEATAAAQLNVGGTVKTVNPGDTLTAAEHVALLQILNGGQQSIQLNANGIATGGTFSLAMLNQTINNLVIPKGVTAIQDFGTGSNVNLTGNLTNSGSIYAISTNAAVTNAIFNATNIFNQQGGILSSILPTNGLPGLNSALNISQLDLTLNALQNIINAGTIRSSGALSLNAGGSIINALPAGITGPSPVMQAMTNLNLSSAIGNITNSGIMSAMSNINVIAQATRDLTINNVAGQLQAINGSINIRDALFTGKANTRLWGGDVIAKELNMFSGKGIATINVEKLTPLVNITAGEAHVTTASDILRLGSINLSGDPSFFNTAGDVEITSDLIFDGEKLAIVASGNILTGNYVGPNAGPVISTNCTSCLSGNGGDILMVAGADFTSNGPSVLLPPPPGDTSSILTINGGNAAGGRIDLSVGDALTQLSSTGGSTGGGAGGNIQLIAFAGNDGNSGTIKIPTAVTVDASGGTGANGNITMIAGALTGNSIQTGGLTTSGGASGGQINLFTATPGTVNGSPVTVVNGGITSGDFTVGTTRAATVSLAGNLLAGNSISITGGQAISTTGNLTVGTRWQQYPQRPVRGGEDRKRHWNYSHNCWRNLGNRTIAGQRNTGCHKHRFAHHRQ
jgi:hypothetical protein